jgi:hypothetical protein
MRIAIASVAGAAVALVAASMLGVAAAEAPTTAPVRTVSVVGVASAPIELTASASQADAAYRQAMTSAMTDGQEKAAFLAGKAAASVGAVQSISERGGDISCTSEEQYVEYRGEQPDFGSTPVTSVPVLGAKAITPGVRRRSRRPSAKKAAAVSCTLRTAVALVYPLS